MKRTSFKVLKHLPFQMATLYFILFIISIVASMITVNCGNEVFKTYTSCRGSKVYNINWIGVVIALQILFLFVSVEPDPNKNKNNEEKILNYNDNKPSDIGNYDLCDNNGLYSKGLSSGGYRVQINPSIKKIKNKTVKDNLKNLSVVFEDKEREGMPKSIYTELSDSSITIKLVKAKEVIKRRVKICWSSIWMLSYNFVIFMGVHGSVMASRIHANISLNKYGIETCQHLNDVPLNLTSPSLNFPILSEPVFLLTYISFTIHEIVIRKSESCFLIKNFFGKHYFKESVILGSIRLVIQSVLFISNITLIVLCVSSGFGSPMHVLVGFSISMLALWINSLLSQLLELTHYGKMKSPTLDYSYIWSVLSAFVLWFCGFFYYTSVYGVPYKRLYFYLNPISWIILIFLTYYKRREIFNASQYLQGFVPTFT